MGMLLRHLIDNGREIALTPDDLRDSSSQEKRKGVEGSRSALFTAVELVSVGLESTFQNVTLYSSTALAEKTDADVNQLTTDITTLLVNHTCSTPFNGNMFCLVFPQDKKGVKNEECKHIFRVGWVGCVCGSINVSAAIKISTPICRWD